MIASTDSNIFNIKDKTLAYIITLRSGGKTTARIIDELLKRPYNKNQLAKKLNLNYKTITYHLNIIYEKDYVRKVKYFNQYFYIPTDKLINNLNEYYLLKEIIENE